jgi:hypothetical protein
MFGSVRGAGCGYRLLMIPLTFSGRTFQIHEMELLRELARDYAALGVTEIARTACELLNWTRPSGGLKNHECRLLLEKLQQIGVLSLPAIRATGRRGPRPVAISAESDAESMLTGEVSDYFPIELKLLESSEQGHLWRQYIERYHYLGYRVPMGAHLRYWAQTKTASGNRVLACLLWTSPAWSMAPRDEWIGWTAAERQRHLQRVVNNARFLVLPWVRIQGLASHLLARSARQLPGDWQRTYGYRPLLLETLVDRERFSGTCYRAANWIALGQTKGRGRRDRHKRANLSVKEIFVFPLCRNVQLRLKQPTDSGVLVR